jgi:hypothetical protein
MNLELSYQFPFTSWSVFNVFGKFSEILKKTSDYNITEINSSETPQPLNYCSKFSPHQMVITNLDNGKYIIVSYNDSPICLGMEMHGWDVNKRVHLVTSSGANRDMETVPFSYLCYNTNFDLYYLNAKKMSQKKINKLIFRGHLYGERQSLADLGIINLTNEKLMNDWEYFNDLTNTKICLSLNGVGEICNRDMEILSARSVLFRPLLKQKFHNRLIPDYHYVAFEHNPDPKIQSEIILNKYEEIKKDKEFLTFISENGYNWFKENGTISANVKLLFDIINFKDLK